MLVKRGNLKIDRNTGIFNIPAGKDYTCAVTCDGCYAVRAQIFRHHRVLPYRIRMYKETLKDTFVSSMIEEISSNKGMIYFRIHESGDFYSQDYIGKWTQIIKAFPNIKFYAYTKRLDEFDFSKIQSLPNFNLILSYVYIDGKKRINFGYPDTIDKYLHSMQKCGDKVMICPSVPKSDIKCMKECTFCADKGNIPLFYKH